ncbi:UNVERIFIED_CONTAM: hypothetical protein K2H54_071935 [Gekko kuhli]
MESGWRTVRNSGFLSVSRTGASQRLSPGGIPALGLWGSPAGRLLFAETDRVQKVLLAAVDKSAASSEDGCSLLVRLPELSEWDPWPGSFHSRIGPVS